MIKANTIRDYIFIVLGSVISALGWSAFLIPGQIVGGGIGGLASLIYFATGISPGVFYFSINIVLILLAVKILGASFGLRTIIGMSVMSVCLVIFPLLFPEPVVQDLFLATILGSAISGLGIGMAIAHQGSTGGTEIIAMIVNHYRNISPGRIMLFLDVFIIGSSYFLFFSLEKLVYGYVMMAVATYTIDMYLEGSKQSVQIFIISMKKEEIARLLDEKVSRGITVFKAEGWYKRQAVDPLMIVSRRTELPQIMSIIRSQDEHAFVSVSKVMGVYGNGFDRIKF